MRYLVTGGAGFIGSALVKRLLRAGATVRVLDDASRGRPRRLEGLGADVEVVAGDVRDEGAVASACAGMDAVCHLASIQGTRNFYTMPERVLDVGIRGMLNVLAGALRHGVRGVFVASSSEVYGMASRIPTDETVALTIADPLNPRFSYAGAKLASELLALHSRVERVVVFRPHNVYGPDMGWEHVIPELAVRIGELARASGGPLRVLVEGTGEETRAFCYVDDAVEGIVAAMERGEHRGIYHVGTDVETRIADLALAIGRWYGRPVEVVPGPPAAGTPARRCPDIAKLRALGYEPRVLLRDGLDRTIAWYDAHASERPRAEVTA